MFFYYWRVRARSKLFAAREAYISFLSSCLPDFFLYMYTRFSSAYISHGYLSFHLQSFRGTSRHAPVAFFSFSVFSSQRLESRGISGYKQFPAKILLHKPWGFHKTSKTSLLTVNVVVLFEWKKILKDMSMACESISLNLATASPQIYLKTYNNGLHVGNL